MCSLSRLFLLLLLTACPLLAAEPLDPQSVAFFEKRIRPVLADHCFECHSADSKKVQGGLRLDSRGGIRQGGDSGPAVVPGDIDEGTLLGALRHDSFEMPPQGKLAESVIRDFETWIRKGAADPRDGPVTVTDADDWEERHAFWSFQPRQNSQPPHDPTGWSQSNIDRFVHAGWKDAGLVPTRDASDITLLRRLSYDLIGLPPTPEQIQGFLGDPSGQSYERTVDRLLDSPLFGERWGRHWLDVARFAESTGGGRTRLLSNAWRYRDYVIASLNHDKPFDVFIREQIAGDLLPAATDDARSAQLTATGFLVLGPTNYELQDKSLLQMEIVDEQLDTIGRAFLGMTIGCARCHDHKFDPISTKDYYALAGIFRSTKTVEHANVSNFIERPLPVPESHQAEIDRHALAVANIERKLAKVNKRLEELAGDADRIDVSRLSGIVIDDRQAKVTGTWSMSTSVKPFVGESYLHADGSTGSEQTVSFEAKLPKAGEYEVRLAYTPHGNRAVGACISVEHREGTAERVIDQRQTPPIGSLFVSLGRFPFDEGTARVVISNRETTGKVIADAVQFLDVATIAERNDARPSELIEALRAEKKATQVALNNLRKQAPQPAPRVLSVFDQEQVEDCPLHIRGNIKNLGSPVPRGFLTAAMVGPPPKLDTTSSGRVELANWIASPTNPLTARVAANRIWLHLFGQGLVRTPDNFGLTGTRPTHPELLDFLATQLVEDQWSLKGLIKQIVMSRTYRMDSKPSELSLRQDPSNRLLSHQNRRRLDAEAIRDAILFVSGDLDLSQGGSLVTDGIKSEFGYRLTSHRRSVYVPVFRNTLHDLFEVFDFANPNLVSGNRNSSILPTQALYLMNSPFVIEQAQTAAERLNEQPDDRTARIHDAFLRALGRPPADGELELVIQYLSAWTAAELRDDSGAAQQEAWSHIYQNLFACVDFRYVN